ncbi:hypothetical protein CDV36_009047 [Fusarium kuroshium]|uniref:Uncharacterized protein n=1 Tax=Fusarium kuroshium TaxID=2010991 RepID=A0A3M2S190_9HYPO|nr:hypothetical protein CDV36_009047 [Fusarium kuroshium]
MDQSAVRATETNGSHWTWLADWATYVFFFFLIDDSRAVSSIFQLALQQCNNGSYRSQFLSTAQHNTAKHSLRLDSTASLSFQ